MEVRMQQHGGSSSVGIDAAPRQADAKEPFWRGLITGFTRRLIDFKTLNWPLRLAVCAALAEILLTSGLLVFNGVAQPNVRVHPGGASPAFMTPSSLIVIYLSFALSWSLLLTGALHAHGSVRLVALVVGSAVLGLEPLVTVIGVTTPTLIASAALQGAAIAGLWAWAGLLTLLAARSGPGGH